MTSAFTYRSPTTPAGPGWSETITGGVRLGSIDGLSQQAQLGAVDNGGIQIDDPNGDVGHDSDGIVGLKQFDWRETTAPAGRRVIWTGYIGERSYARGQGEPHASLIAGPARVIDVDLADINSFLSFRTLVDGGASGDASFNRPAETDIQRVQALLAVYYLSDTLYDGLVATTGGVAMDANDYTGSRPVDVLNDCAQQSGRNFFVIYDEAGDYGDPGNFVLFYNKNGALVYPANDPDFRVSNVYEDVDWDASGTVYTGPTWPPMVDARLTLDPTRVAAGVSLQVGETHVYRQSLPTSYKFAYRDMDGTTDTLKTVPAAQARGDRYLAENDTEDTNLVFTLVLPAAHVNDAMAGQYFPVRFQHLRTDAVDLSVPEFVNVRCVRRTVRQDMETTAWYHVEYECAPMTDSGSDVTCAESIDAALLTQATADSLGEGSGTVGTVVNVSVSATPTADGPSLLFGLIATWQGDVPEDHLLATPSGYTEIDSVISDTGAPGGINYSAPGQPSGVYYRALAAGAGAQTLTTTYAKGWGKTRWHAYLLSLASAATTPVQHVAQGHAGNHPEATLPATPTPGNILVAFVNCESSFSPITITPLDAGWTELVQTEDQQPDHVGERRTVAVYVRCVNEGDPALWTWTGGTSTVAAWVAISEWTT